MSITKKRMKVNGKIVVYMPIDMQDGFVYEGVLANPRAVLLVDPMAAFLREEKKKGAVVFATQDTHEPDDKEFEMFSPHCVAGTSEHQLVRQLWGIPDRIFQKTRYSGFFRTDLEKALQRLGGPNKVLARVMGVCTDICVLHTVAGLRNRDYEVEVYTDLTDTFDVPGHPGDEMKEWALAHMEHILGAKIVGG